MRKHPLSRKHILLINLQVFGRMHSEMGMDEENSVHGEWNNFVGRKSLIPLPYCFHLLLILSSGSGKQKF